MCQWLLAVMTNLRSKAKVTKLLLCITNIISYNIFLTANEYYKSSHSGNSLAKCHPRFANKDNTSALGCSLFRGETHCPNKATMVKSLPHLKHIGPSETQIHDIHIKRSGD